MMPCIRQAVGVQQRIRVSRDESCSSNAGNAIGVMRSCKCHCSFSERSYKAALLNKKEKLSSEQGSDSKTKREVAAAPSAPFTAPNVQRPTPPTPIVIESSPSDAFTTPKSNSRENLREKRARVLTMSSPPKKLDLPKVESRILKEAIKQRKEEKEGASNTNPIYRKEETRLSLKTRLKTS